MAIPFDWTGFTEDIREKEKLLLGQVMQIGQEERAEKRQIRGEKRAEESQLRVMEESAKVQYDYTTKLKEFDSLEARKEAEWRVSFESELAEHFGSPQIRDAIDFAISSDDPAMRAKAAETIQAMEDVRLNKEVDPSVFNWLGGAEQPILDLMRQNDEMNREFQLKKQDSAARRAYMQKHGEYFELMGKAASSGKVFDWKKHREKVKDFKEDLRELKLNPRYIELMEDANAGKIEAGSEEENELRIRHDEIRYIEDSIAAMEREALVASGFDFEEHERKIKKEKEVLEEKERQEKLAIATAMEAGEQPQPRVEEYMKSEKVSQAIVGALEKIGKAKQKKFKPLLEQLFKKGNAEVPEEHREEFEEFVRGILYLFSQAI